MRGYSHLPEATGVYHFALAVALSRTQALEVMVINPKTAHNFAKVLMNRSKTDEVYAEILAIYCQRMPFDAWGRPADEMITLRAISQRVAALSKLKTQTKNQHHALSSTQKTPDLVIDTTTELIQILAENDITQRIECKAVGCAHAGLDPRYFESGSSVTKKPRISKAGNKYI